MRAALPSDRQKGPRDKSASEGGIEPPATQRGRRHPGGTTNDAERTLTRPIVRMDQRRKRNAEPPPAREPPTRASRRGA